MQEARVAALLVGVVGVVHGIDLREIDSSVVVVSSSVSHVISIVTLVLLIVLHLVLAVLDVDVGLGSE